MDHQGEYHDPDYPGAVVKVKEEPSSLCNEENIEKIKRIIHREFSNELEVRENEIMLIDQRMSSSRRMLHRLRYALVNSYYRDQKLQLSANQIQDEVAAQHEPRARAEVSSLLREGQRRLHPSVRKLLGKQTADLDEILFRSNKPRNKTRKDYSAMLQTRNYTIAADTTKSLRPDKQEDYAIKQEDPCTSRSRKVPRQIDPRVTNVMTLNEATRNQRKYRYRIIIGNTSKYAPPASRADRSTHKWLLYVRGPPDRPDLSCILTRVVLRLHHSYAPHHTVHIDKPPFHVSRRGWGEFPAKVELHFALPERNRPACVEHTIKLDRNYTGLQTLGAETIVDVWLYSTKEMIQYEFKETDDPPQMDIQTDTQLQLKPEPVDDEPVQDTQTDNWLDFFSNTTEMNVDEMIIKPAKKPEERNDLENLIEPNVIQKENTEIVENDDSQIEFDPANVKTEPEESWTENLNYKNVEHISEDLPNQLLTQPTSPKKRIMKYMDPTTGKIYYLEMDRNLDLSKVQEIVINSKGNVKTAKISPIKANGLKNIRKNTKKGGVSLLKPEIKSQLKIENSSIKNEKPKSILKKNFTHIENDHCYLGVSWTKSVSFTEKPTPVLQENEIKQECVPVVVVKKEKSLFNCLCANLSRLTSVKVAVNYLLKNIPIISDSARDPDFVKCFPFIVDHEERYWRYDFAKRRNIEWSRAKLINKLLTEHLSTNEQIWRTKQILVYSRFHGFYPIRTEIQTKSEDMMEWSSWTDLETRRLESNIKEIYPNATDVTTLSVFNPQEFHEDLSESLEITDSDEELDVVNDSPVRVKREVNKRCSELTVLPVDSEDDRLRFLFIEKKCADLGLELGNEDVGNGYSYSAVHAVMLSAMRSFAEELVRHALANRLQEESAARGVQVWAGSSSRSVISLAHVYAGLSSRRLATMTSRALAASSNHTYETL